MTQTQHLFSFVSTLAGVKRFSLLNLVHQENVLEHTGMVAIFAMAITSQINENILQEWKDTGGKMGELINAAHVLSKAIVHDFDETVTGDVVRPTKYFSQQIRDDLKSLEQHGIAQIADRLQLPFLTHLHSNAKDGPDGYIVAFADLMAAVHRVWQEVLVFHNYHMVPAAFGMREFACKLALNCPTHAKQYNVVLERYFKQLMEILDRVCALQSEYVEPGLSTGG